MPRTINLSVKPEDTDVLVSGLNGNEGVTSVQVHRHVFDQTGEDLVVAQVANSHMFEVMRLIEQTAGRPSSLTVSQPDAVHSESSQVVLNADIVESIWEETELTLQRTSNTDFNFIALMVLAGIVASVGLSTGALHLVIAAMLLIPGFQPIANIPLGIVLRNRRLVRLGLVSTLTGYSIFTAAAALGFHLIRLAADTSIQAFHSMPMVQYWTSFSWSSVLVTVVAAAAGIVIIPTHRSVLTAGVMVALSLVPGAAIFGISLSTGYWESAVRGLLQWTINFASVVATGMLIFWLKNVLVHKRKPWH